MCGQEKTCKQFVQEKKRMKESKQESLESSIKKKQKVSQIMELHTCKRLCTMVHDTKYICRLKALKLLEQPAKPRIVKYSFLTARVEEVHEFSKLI
jgi:hypothetical protein